MTYRYDIVQRLEPVHAHADLSRALAAQVADPVWFLGRQWQLGELRGENASSPVSVEYRASLSPVDPLDGDPDMDPRVVPPEAIIESEPDDFWTTGRRVSVGRDVARAAASAGRPLPSKVKGLLLRDLPVPYDVLDGTGPDGRRLFARRAELGLRDEWFPAGLMRQAPRDLWNPSELAYDADLSVADAELTMRRHDGGQVDWWSVDAASTPTPAAPAEPVSMLASPLRYPGAPRPRWWEIEGTDIGGYGPDRGHFASLLMLELVSSHSDDWFTFPITAPVGHLLTMHEVAVVDAFGDRWVVSPPDDGWTMYAVTGLDARDLLLWSAVPTALSGPPTDQVDFLVDEDANVVWAVERLVRGRHRPAPAAESLESAAPADPTERVRYVYRPGAEVPPFRHPYVIEELDGQRWLVQGRLADLSGPTGALMPEPDSDLLRDPASGGQHPVHRLHPSAVPVMGLQVERRYQLARRTDGRPVLWAQRRRVPLPAVTTTRLQFDILAPR